MAGPGRRRARFVPVTWRPPARRPDEIYPFVLNTGRIRDQWHTMTRTGRVPRLMAHTAEPFIAVNPEDAARLGIAEGGLVRMQTRVGSAILKARVVPEQRPGDVFAPMHWTHRYASAGPIDPLAGAAPAPGSGDPGS